MSLFNRLRAEKFFASLSDEEIERLATISTIRSYPKEFILYYERKKSDRLLFLLQGLAKAYKIDKHDNETFLYYIYAGSIVTEMNDLHVSEFISYANVSIVEDAQILSVDYVQFKELFLARKKLLLEVTNEILKRATQLQALIDREFIFDAVSKVSMMLDNDLAMFNKLKRHDISLMLHIQPATLSRVLNRLKRNDIIAIIQGEVEVRDAEALRKIYKDRVDEVD